MITLSARGIDVVVDWSGGAPTIAYFGATITDPSGVQPLVTAAERPIVHGSLDVVAPASMLPEHGSGWAGRPGITGHRRGGTAWAPRFVVSTASLDDTDTPTATIVATDAVAKLAVTYSLRLDHALTIDVELTNTGDDHYLLNGLLVTVPIPQHAEELLWFDGRWSREFQPVRQPFVHGTWSVENRSGRSSQDNSPTVFVGSRAFGEWRGDVWGVHLAWSANHHLIADVLPDGRKVMQVGELLHPGEIALAPGESYRAPTVHAVHSPDGLTPATWGFHRQLRSRPAHPVTPRPVLINTWEAVYFNHDAPTLRALADAAAAVGVERYVLDDGWFGGRRDDRRGLGDWVVSADAHPRGLTPLIEHVTGLGMDFGIWFEPEMVSPDSDVYRAHPEWALITDGYEPVRGRHQLVLNLAHPDAYAHVRDQMHAVLSAHDIAFVKWDMNRHHVHASGVGGSAGTHAQTLAVYRLLDELRTLHPSVEFESCASGGGRVDFGILQHTDRVWTSDCNDALERQVIQRGASMLIPPELMGCHIGPPTAHTTGRTHTLAFRATTAMFGHLGIEWNVLELTDAQRAELAGYVALHKRFRPLLHSGDVVRFDSVNNGDNVASQAYGVYAADRHEALVCVTQLRTGSSLTPPPLRLPALLDECRYRVDVIDPPGAGSRAARRPLAWTSGATLTGRQLARHGIQVPSMDPESALLIHLTAER